MVASRHRYPARNYPASRGGIASARIDDLIVKGLAELGHDVFYCLPEGAAECLPEGVSLVYEFVWSADALHLQHFRLTEKVETREVPWVRTCHSDMEQMKGLDRSIAGPNFIFVSKTLASLYGSERWVHNGIDPSEFIYSESKDDYLLFMCCLDRALDKGLEAALGMSELSGYELVIAGSAADPRTMAAIEQLCEGKNVRLVGEVQGLRRAELLAGARALLFPTRINEGFGLVMAEALISGTPVVCSNKGACPELISPEAGFVCKDRADYVDALSRLHEISPERCRDKAMKDFHYLRMARDYVKEYEKEICRAAS
jgi:glycosyltransferase involved in cell wall biosynthesis